MIELACITSPGFVRHTAAMLHSALAHTGSEASKVHVLFEHSPDQADLDRLEIVVAGSEAKLHLHCVRDPALASLHQGYFPRAIWLRIWLPDLLPESTRVLYLDSDVIVTDTLLPLWRTDLGEHLLAAVTNPFYPFMPPHPKLALGLERPEDYFNSGVLLLNLDRMRREGTASSVREYALRHPGSDYPDQDALNAVARDRWLPLHPRWNAQSTLFELPAEALPFPTDEAVEAVQSPAVVHFIGPFKPWQYLCRHPLRNLYFEHADRTPWGRPALEGRTLRTIFLRPLPLPWIDRWFAVERALRNVWRGLLGRVGLRTGPCHS